MQKCLGIGWGGFQRPSQSHPCACSLTLAVHPAGIYGARAVSGPAWGLLFL